MPFPRKFKELLESSPAELPDHVWLSYCVCGCLPESCGWRGWVIEGVSRVTADGHGKILESNDYGRCPKCGNQLFRTEEVQFVRSPNQPQPTMQPGIDYEIVPTTYIDDDDPQWEVERERLREAENNNQR